MLRKSHLWLALLLCNFAYAQSAPAIKTAEQQFKNIQVLQGTPADQVFPAMQFISASLGVDCTFCHVENKFDADDKPAKKTARQMITMTLAINKESFNSRKEVTCHSCHHGDTHPMGIPPVVASDVEPEQARKEPSSSAAPTADQIIEKYIAALGGADAIHKITSRVGKGSISFMGHQSSIELFTKAPNKRMSITHSSEGESITAFDGENGWLGNSGRPARVMSGQENEAAKLDADFYLATRLKEIFTEFRVGSPDKVDGKAVHTLICRREGRPPVRLYFDQSSGLLVRQIRYTDTPVGRSPTQIDYADYRELDGVKVPFRWILSRVSGRFTIQLAEAQQNVPVADEKFVKPSKQP